MRRKKKTIECIEYLSVSAPLDKVDHLEDKQSKYIHEYVKNKEYMIVGTERRHGFSQNDVDRQWHQIVDKIRKKQVDGVIVANMSVITDNLIDAFIKVAQVQAAVVNARAGIDERAADDRRDIRAVDHVDLLGLADTEACRLEAGLERVLADQKVPRLIPDLILFLGREAVASRGGLGDRGQVVDLVGELGISDLFPVDFSDAHLALLERAGALIAEIAEQEGQQGDSDDDRNDDAAASSQCVKCCHIGSIVFENAVSCWITKPKGNKILLCKCNPASETAILLRSTVRFVRFLACFRFRRLRTAATVRRSGFSSVRSVLRASIPKCRSADAPLYNAPARHGSGPRPARPRGRFPLRRLSRGRESRI